MVLSTGWPASRARKIHHNATASANGHILHRLAVEGSSRSSGNLRYFPRESHPVSPAMPQNLEIYMNKVPGTILVITEPRVSRTLPTFTPTFSFPSKVLGGHRMVFLWNGAVFTLLQPPFLMAAVSEAAVYLSSGSFARTTDLVSGPGEKEKKGNPRSRNLNWEQMYIV